ncbi:DNA-binding RFX-type winged-helix domain,Winged helix-turn-helix DNA-binding domain [Cinara cedri]|uniref:DNA-binding RFX-type winged-helix domain,Winged helix-turn-helix DNA-binding domain n=1 Tax=Cinara cedri TaxID=506608 RepID=A0A5E4NA53_9HEMI|nr:DNA-binding RFX-type winged-helix domain,Winged helix-turn-helix DNA-binding domain [Cinara cedri]
MATSVRSGIKLEGSTGTGSQISTITVVTAGGVGQTLVVQPVQQASVVRTSIDQNVNSNRQLENAILCGTSPVHDDGSDKSLDDDEHNIDHKDRSASTVTVDNSHYIVAASEGTQGRSYTSLTPVPTLVPETEAVGSDDVGHSTYVQYVEGTGEHSIFTNGQMAYPVYTVGESGTMYQTGQTHYYTPSTNSYSQVTNTLGQPTCQAQIIGNGTYIIQQNVDNDHIITTTQRDSPNSAISSDVSYLTVNATDSGTANSNIDQLNGVDSDGGMQSSGLIHANRISPATVNWLMENYEMAEGVSLPRSTLYNHYLTHCSETKIDPVNAASFGKLIRSVFMGLRTRRLGTRGNSKYHYYGIRVKASSLLNDFSNEESLPGRTNQSSSSKKIKFIKTEERNCNQYTTNSSDSANCSQNSIPSSPQTQNQEYLGDGANAVPEFPDIILDEIQLDDNCTLEDVDTFKNLYREHYEAFLGAILNLEFGTVESLWREFWRSQDNNNDECEEEKYLSKEKLYSLSKCKTLQLFVKTVDFLFYQNLVKVLIPDVLRPVPGTLTQAIRNFSKGLESWLTSAMQGCPEEMISIKVTAVSAFAQTLRRYTSLNHLAQAARAVLQNYTQINQMLADLNRVDFRNVQEQASWVCQCDSTLVQQLEADFKHTLQQQNSLEEWAIWLKSVVDNCLKQYRGTPNFTKEARQFLLKWSFYSSMVIRDLTLRSAASFGSFHLIRLLYDEYMFYLIEHEVASVTGETQIAVMSSQDSKTTLPTVLIDFEPTEYTTTCNGKRMKIN